MDLRQPYLETLHLAFRAAPGTVARELREIKGFAAANRGPTPINAHDVQKQGADPYCVAFFISRVSASPVAAVMSSMQVSAPRRSVASTTMPIT